jgi:cellobiose-specific phosphotransferase system component IIC
MSTSSDAWRPSSAAYSVLRKAGDAAFVAATRDALPWSFGGLLIAFAALLPLTHEPGPFFGPSLGLRVSAALLPAFGVMGAALVCALAWRYALAVNGNAALAAGSCALAYVIALPSPASHDALAYLRVVGPSGLFLALVICGVWAASDWAAALPSTALRFARDDKVRALVASAVVLLMSLALRLAHVSLGAIVLSMLAPLGHLGDTYAALLAIVLVEMLLWSCGLHGPALLAAIVTPVYLTLQMQNTQAYARHEALPHVVVVSLFLFVFPGGAGGTLPLALLLLRSRVPQLRKIGRVSLVPSIFNANEPLLFGVPVVFNPFLVPPFVAAPLVLATITYVAVASGWVARAAFYVPSTVPTLLSTYAATLDPRAVALAAVNVVVAAAIYWPFLRAYEHHLEMQQA